jgi:hypothetical protein
MATRKRYTYQSQKGPKLLHVLFSQTYLEIETWSDTHPPKIVYDEIVERFGEDGFDDDNRAANMATLKAEWEAVQYKRDREKEYPTIDELIVALYDTDDKSAIESARAAVKAKYPKP